MTKIPEGWAESTIPQVAEVLDTKRIPINSDERAARIDGKSQQSLVAYYGATGQVGWIDTHLFDEDLVLLGEDGVSFLDPGKPKAYRVSGKSWVNNHAHVLRARQDALDWRLLEAQLNTLNYTGHVTGSTRLKLTQGAMNKLPILVPPLAEQKRIADKLDTVLARVDAVNTRLARVAPLLKRFRQSVLAAATSGRLTADLNGGAVSAPVELGDLCNVYGGKRLPKGFQLSDFDTGFPYVRVTDFDSFSVKTDQLKYVPEEAAREISRYIINASDVYISIAGSIGLVGQVPVAIDGANLTENAARIVPNKKLRPVFLMYQLASPQLQEQMHEKKIATTQDKLGLFRIKSLNIWLPGLDEQTEIVRRVETLFAFADRLEARLAQAQTAATRLTPALLAKAFRGELVPQDPNDEPAAELLRRLQAERATAPKASAGRGRKAAVRSEG